MNEKLKKYLLNVLSFALVEAGLFWLSPEHIEQGTMIFAGLFFVTTIIKGDLDDKIYAWFKDNVINKLSVK